MESFGARLRRLRTASALSTSDLAFRVGVTEGAIRQLESGRTKSPSFSIGMKLSRILDVDPWSFCMGDEDAASTLHSGTLKERVARLEARMDAVERQAGTSAARPRAATASRR